MMKSKLSFSAGAPGVIALMPDLVRSVWNLMDTGQQFCTAMLVDLVRSLATNTSWSRIADVVNEMRTTSWVRDIAIRYLKLCETLEVKPIDLSSMPEHPKVFLW